MMTSVKSQSLTDFIFANANELTGKIAGLDALAGVGVPALAIMKFKEVESFETVRKNLDTLGKTFKDFKGATWILVTSQDILKWGNDILVKGRKLEDFKPSFKLLSPMKRITSAAGSVFCFYSFASNIVGFVMDEAFLRYQIATLTLNSLISSVDLFFKGQEAYANLNKITNKVFVISRFENSLTEEEKLAFTSVDNGLEAHRESAFKKLRDFESDANAKLVVKIQALQKELNDRNLANIVEVIDENSHWGLQKQVEVLRLTLKGDTQEAAAVNALNVFKFVTLQEKQLTVKYYNARNTFGKIGLDFAKNIFKSIGGILFLFNPQITGFGFVAKLITTEDGYKAVGNGVKLIAGSLNLAKYIVDFNYKLEEMPKAASAA